MNCKILSVPFLLLCLTLNLAVGYSSKGQNMNFEWAKKVGRTKADKANAITHDAQGNVYTAGTICDTVAFGSITLVARGYNDAFVAKQDNMGNFLWAVRMGGTGILGSDEAFGIALDKANNIYVTGTFWGTASFGGFSLTATEGDAFVAKINNLGDFIWARQIGGAGNQYGNAITTDSVGNVIMAGYFLIAANFGNTQFSSSGIADICVGKWNSAGDLLWAKQMGGIGNDITWGVSVDNAGNIYTTGQFSRTASFDSRSSSGDLVAKGNLDVFICKQDFEGNCIWVRQLGSAGGTNVGRGIVVSKTGDIYSTGSFIKLDFDLGGGKITINSFGASDIYIAKINNNGSFVWVKNMGGPLADVGWAIALDQSGDVYTTGYFTATADFNPDTAAAFVFPFSTTGNSDQDVFISRLDAGGHFVNARQLGGAGNDNGWSLSVDALGNIFTAGFFNLTTNFNQGSVPDFLLTSSGDRDIFIHKLSQSCSTYGEMSATSCDSFSFNGKTYTTTGIYKDTLVNAKNCDSILSLNITINNSTNKTLTESVCNSYVLGSTTYTTSGTYTQKMVNAIGCDSILTLHLTINEDKNTVTETACGYFLYNGETYMFSGSYPHTYTNINGCDSLVILELTINPRPDSAVLQSGTTLIAGTAEEYQWIDCNNAGQAIAGAISQRFLPEENGLYAVAVTAIGGCKDTSACYEVSGITSISALLNDEAALYPNPTTGQLEIKTTVALHNAKLRLINITGMVVLEKNVGPGKNCFLDITNQAKGVYFLELWTKEKTWRTKVVRE